MKGSRLHFDLIKVYLDLAGTKSFSQAARRNYLTQSAVSQQLAFLERRFGCRLAERGTRWFALTEKGETVARWFRQVAADYEKTMEELRNPGELAGAVNVEAVYSVGLYDLPPYVKTFIRRYGRVNLHVEYDQAERIYADVLQGRCDIGLVAYPRRHPQVRVVPFRKDRLVMVCAADHPLARRRAVALGDLEQRPFVAFESRVPTRIAIDDILRRHDVSVNVVHEFDNIETLKRTVEVGAGVTILPRGSVAPEVRSGSLRCVPFSDGVFHRPTGILSRRGKTLSRAAQAFVRWLKAPAPADPRRDPPAGR
jgi:DNA-binding transcriptional LysR family regulator